MTGAEARSSHAVGLECRIVSICNSMGLCTRFPLLLLNQPSLIDETSVMLAGD